MYRLFYYPRNASWAIHMLFREMGLPHELVYVDRNANGQKSKEYLQLNPSGRIPTLIDDGQAIFESGAIALHLCEKHPELGLAPLTNPEFLQWFFYLLTTLQPELTMYFYPERLTEGDACANSICAAQQRRVTDMFALLDQALIGKEYLVEGRATACDFFLFMLAHWASDFESPPLAFDNLGRYLRGFAKRSAVAEASTIEGTDLAVYNQAGFEA